MNTVALMPSEALVEGEPQAVTVSGEALMVVRFEGEPHAIGNVCSHQYALLTDGWYEDGCVECPLHQAVFDIRTGQPSCGPTTVPVKVYRARDEAGRVCIDI